MRSLSKGVVEDFHSTPFHLCQLGIHPSDALPFERLRMIQPEAFMHQSVMIDEIVEWFAPVPPGVLIDATLGGAGHAGALLGAYPNLQVLGIDQDIDAIAAASQRLATFGDRVAVRQARFDELAALVAEAFPGRPVVGVLFDLGVSSPQLDRPERGFSYRNDGPLDMRMDRGGSLTAANIVNTYEQDELTRVLQSGGEDRFARRISHAIVAARPLASTTTLAEVVRNAIPAPARRKPGDPARRTFQALRLEVNNEIGVLAAALDSALDLLAPGGRCVTLAYHSGEDRLIKQRFLTASTGGCICPPRLPCVCGAQSRGRVLTRGARKASAQEVARNPRAESARLRGMELGNRATSEAELGNRATSEVELGNRATSEDESGGTI